MKSKKVPDAVAESIWQKIRVWHIHQHAADLQAAFELGDMLLNACIMTGLLKEQVIARLTQELGDLAYSYGAYRRAGMLSRKFNSRQRAVLITHGVTVVRCSVLASSQYDGAARVKIIMAIKAGKIKNWANIKSIGETKNLKRTAILRYGLRNIDDVIGIQIRDRGEFQRDLMLDGLRALLSQVSEPILVEELNVAVIELRKHGHDLRSFELKSSK